jgi:hypothetical protein
VTRIQVLYWQEIPSVVRVLAEDGAPVSHQLPDWFQQEIDRRAMEQGLTGSDDYLEQWHWGDPEERPGSAPELIDALVGEFMDQHGGEASQDG